MQKIILLEFCGESNCPDRRFNCDCRRNLIFPTNESQCIEYSWVCDGVPDCDDGSDEIDCICSEDQCQCSNCEQGTDCDSFFKCLPKIELGDSKISCREEAENCNNIYP